MFMFVEVYASILAYTEQSDLIEIVDDEGAAWTITDCFAELNCGNVCWLEGKYAAQLIYEDQGPPKFALGLDRDTAHRAARFERALAKVGYPWPRRCNRGALD